MLSRALKETTKHAVKFRHIQKKGIVAAIGLDLGEADIGGDGIERVHDAAAFDGGVKPVAGEGDDAETDGRMVEELGRRTAMPGR